MTYEADLPIHHVTERGPYEPLPNREGPCFLCGVHLGWYETKLIERDGGEGRISCVFGCRSADMKGLPEDVRKRFRHWTDG